MDLRSAISLARSLALSSWRAVSRRRRTCARPRGICPVSYWVGVGVRVHGFDALLAVSFAAASFAATVSTAGSGWSHRFQGGQVALLGPADVVIPHAAHHALELRAKGPCCDIRPQGAHAWRRFLCDHAMTMVPDNELSVGTFQCLYPQYHVAGAFSIGQQLQDLPVVLRRVVPSHCRVSLNGLLDLPGLSHGHG